MASIITHGLVAAILGKAFVKKKQPFRFYCYLALCSMLPDIDVLGFNFGIAYGDFWGHRGFTHSLVFALIVGFVVGLVFYRRLGLTSSKWWGYVALYSFVTASHGIFDAMTNGGLGIAFFAPFNNARYFLPWTPVNVTPVGFNEFFSQRAFSILLSEGIYILAPLLVISFILGWGIRKVYEF